MKILKNVSEVLMRKQEQKREIVLVNSLKTGATEEER